MARDLHSVASLLQAARTAFAAQGRALANVSRDAESASQRLVTAAHTAAEALEREHNALAMVRDAHLAQSNRCAESQRAYEVEMREATAYLHSLEEACSMDVAALEEHQRKVQVHALKDSQTVLEGHRPTVRTHGLRGHVHSAAPPPTGRALSPLERAAAEMGVAAESD